MSHVFLGRSSDTDSHQLSSDVHIRHQSTSDDCPVGMRNRAQRFLEKYCTVTH